jgi:hypothetical protein
MSQILVGNKSDMADEKRAVAYAKGKALADEYGIRFFETSAKNNSNVEEVRVRGGWGRVWRVSVSGGSTVSRAWSWCECWPDAGNNSACCSTTTAPHPHTSIHAQVFGAIAKDVVQRLQQEQADTAHAATSSPLKLTSNLDMAKQRSRRKGCCEA